MKKIFVFGFVLGVICLFSNVVESALTAPLPEVQQKIEIKPVEPALTELIPIETLEPISWKIRYGENLTRIAYRYADYRGERSIQGFIEEIEHFNKGKNRCIRNKNLIFEGCKIEIPAYVAAQVRVQNSFNKEIFEENKKNAYQKGYHDKKKETLVLILILTFVLVLAVVALMSVLGKAQKESLARKQAEKEKDELAQKNEMQIRDLKAEKTALECDLTAVKTTLNRTITDLREIEAKCGQTECDLENARIETANLTNQNKTYEERWLSSVEERKDLNASIVALQNKVSLFMKLKVGMPYEFQSRYNGVITDGFTIEEVAYDDKGNPFVTKIKCVEQVCGATDVKPQMSNANSHYWKHKGTSQTERPNGWHE